MLRSLPKFCFYSSFSAVFSFIFFLRQIFYKIISLIREDLLICFGPHGRADKCQCMMMFSEMSRRYICRVSSPSYFPVAFIPQNLNLFICTTCLYKIQSTIIAAKNPLYLCQLASCSFHFWSPRAIATEG